MAKDANRQSRESNDRRESHSFLRIIQILLVGTALCLAVFVFFIRNRQKGIPEDAVLTYPQDAYVDGYGSGLLTLGEAEGRTYTLRQHFIAISYQNLVSTDGVQSQGTYRRTYEKQLAALKASGYVTVTQADIEAFYAGRGNLPEKALLLMFEDSGRETSRLAAPAMKYNNCIGTICFYGDELGAGTEALLSTQELQELVAGTYFELASSGLKPVYINVFDWYGNFYGMLPESALSQVSGFIRTKTHAWMDFLRDEDGLRTESQEAMEQRIRAGYEEVKDRCLNQLGRLPSLFLVPQPNTGAFGVDARVSALNETEILSRFALSMNRLGSSANAMDASAYDLTRLQVKPSFSCNHLLMRIWDDTGDDLRFLVGDTTESRNWSVFDGPCEFDGNRIILTTKPCGNSRAVLTRTLPDEYDLEFTLEGTVVGKKGIRLGTGADGRGGVELLLENRQFSIRQTWETEPLFILDLAVLDGTAFGPGQSAEENELAGISALQEAVIASESDLARRRQAQAVLSSLNSTHVLSLDEGGTPMVAAIDRDDRESRRFAISVRDGQMSVTIDGHLVASGVSVSSGCLTLLAGFAEAPSNLLQSGLDDDVMDAILTSPVIRLNDKRKTVYYQYK